MKKLISLCGLLLLLAGCQSSGPRISGEGSPQLWQHQQTLLQQLESWELQGKLGIRSSAQNASASLFWLQRQDYYDIRVSGPLGQGSARLQGQQGQAQLVAEGQQRQADSPEQLMQQELGWSLPLSNLHWWVRGLPAPGLPYQLQLGPDSLPQQLIQSGWTLNYSRHQAQGPFQLPGMIRLQGKQLQATLLIKQWQPRPTQEAQP